jgi:protein O-mannosyl-transferase
MARIADMKQNRIKQKQSRTINARTNSSTQLSSDSAALPPINYRSRSLLWILAALVAINLVIYAQVRSYEFTQWDDPHYVFQNRVVSQGLTWQGIRWAFATGHAANWHPLTWLSHMLDVQLFGMSAGPHHVINILFHIANTLLVFLLLFRMTAALWRSAFVAGLFAAHPLHVESVAWIAERKDVLSAFFMLLTIWAYIAYVRKSSARRYLLIVLLFALALMSKPMAVTLPLILFLLDIWPLNRLRLLSGQKAICLQLIREKAPLILLAMASSATTLWAQWRGGSVGTIEAYPLGVRVANSLTSYVAYLGNMLWPKSLSAFYPYDFLPALWVIACFLALTGVSFLAVRFSSRHPFFFTGWMWYLTTLGPVIGLIQVGAQARADRYTYVPLIGIFIIIAWGVPEILGCLHNARIPLAIAAGIIICVLSIAARVQAGYWVNGVVLWEHALKLYPGSYFIHSYLGYELKERGEIDRSIQYYNESLRLNPNYAIAHNNLGLALLKKGQFYEALEHFILAVRIKPNLAAAQSNLGSRLAELGKNDEAASHFTMALKLDPDSDHMHFNLGVVLTKQGKCDEAIAHFSEALHLNPGFADAYKWLGNALSIQGKPDEAIINYNEALRIKPDFAEVYNDWGIALANQGKLDEAIAKYREAIRIKPDMAETHNCLANALSNLNKPDEAIAQYREAIRIAPSFSEAHLNMGSALARQGKSDEAAVHYNEALRIKPDLAEAYSGLGNIFWFQRRSKEAIAQYNEAIRLKPGYVDAHNNLGIAYMILGQYDEAMVHFSRVLQIMPDNIVAHRNLGIALLYKGREKEAIPHMNEALRVTPNDKMLNSSLKTALANLKKKEAQSASASH